MLIPAYVENYWKAQWWEFLYIGVPSIVLCGIVAVIALWREHKEDMHVNDEETGPRAGKTLGL